MSTKVKSIITNMVIIILILSNVYLITRPQKLDYEIIIGSPTKIEEENVVGIDYTKSKPIKKKSEYETILFSLMNAPDIEKPDLKGYTPIAVIGMSDPEEGIAHGLGTYWLKEDSIIVKRGSEESPTYKIIDDEYYVEELTKIIKKQVDLYKELYQG